MKKDDLHYFVSRLFIYYFLLNDIINYEMENEVWKDQ